MQLYSKHLGKIPVQVCKENSRQLVELFNAANTDLEQKKNRGQSSGYNKNRKGGKNKKRLTW